MSANFIVSVVVIAVSGPVFVYWLWWFAQADHLFARFFNKSNCFILLYFLGPDLGVARGPLG